jgi:amino acid adenylation domain-containing protein
VGCWSINEQVGGQGKVMVADGLTLGFLYRAQPVSECAALSDDQCTLDYAQLRTRVLALAGQLRVAGVIPGDVVAVTCDRSVESVIGILAVYAVGAAYLPLDLSYPRARLVQMLEDARPRLGVLVPGAPGELLHSLELPFVESAMGEPANALDEPVAVDASWPAYVLFTSGSTGRPKGAVLSRRALGRMVAWHRNHSRLGKAARVLQFATLGFDSSVRDVFATFATGGSLIMASGPQRLDPFRMLELMREQRIERAFLPYVALRALAQAHAEGGTLPGNLRDLMTGGEALSITPAIRQLFAALPDAELHNEYGPTESCVFVTSKPLSGTPVFWPERPDIGAPLPHVRLHVVDEYLQALPDGSEGELLIGGDSLADGYIHRPELDAERFVRFRHQDGTQERVYRSGDRVRREPDGRMEFLGRMDDQVKVAGYRVELGEVESVLIAHPAVRAAAVVAPVVGQGRRLVGHVVPMNKAQAEGALRAELAAHLAARLPPFARPQQLLFHDALALTPNGKIDRLQLEAVSEVRLEETHLAVDATLEERVLALWRELLVAPTLAADDDVFDAGADSLLVMAFVTRLRAMAGGTPSAAAIYALRTPRRQVQALSAMTLAPAVDADPVPAERDIDLPTDVPLSDGQMEKWFVSQFGGMAALTFNESSVLHLDGVLDADALKRSLAMIWGRHEALRFSFAADGSRQHFQQDAPLPLGELDYASPPNTGDERLAAFCDQQVRQPFDMTVAPLVRFTLIRLGEQRHALHVIAHHLVFDGWSLAVLISELAEGYNAFRAGREPAMAAPGSFRRYLIDRREHRLSREAADLDYWRQVHAVPPSPLRLPADRPMPKQPDYAAATERHEFSPALTERLRSEAGRRGVSLFSLLLSGFGVLMARLSGQSVFAVAVPFAGLALADGGASMGDGVSSLPVRMRTDAALPFDEFVSHTHAALLEAADHQGLTLTAIQRMLGVRASHGEAALTGVEFNLLPRMPSVAFEGLDHQLRECARAAMDWDLSLNLSDSGKTLALNLHYATARYDASTVRRWIGFYEALLSSVSGLGDAAARAGTRLADIDVLGTTGRREVLEHWNDTVTPYSCELGLTALIEAQMHRVRQNVAAECGGKTITYAELDRSSRALALALARRGIGRGKLVGICVPRSLEMLIAVVGVLRSGAAYVPLDPTFPAERLRYMAEHSGLQHVLVTDAELLPQEVASNRLLLDVTELLKEPEEQTALPMVGSENLAYVLYTSGSTGKPKGVGITHRNLVNFLLSMSHEPGFGADDVLCAVTTLSFDIAGLELYLPLIVGARLVIATEEEHHEPQPLWDLVERSGCNVLQTTPSLLRLLMDSGRDNEVRNLRLFVGGEALPLEVANSLAGRCREFWNLYGPTETTIWSTVARVRPGLTEVPLGKPIANTRIYVLDANGEPTLPGLIGEIWIGGDGVADGYLHQPELTAERFLADPFVGGDARMYRTGDLGSWRDGVLYFNGRVDNQIKIRGYRIEPGDIEAAADAYAGMRECVAVAHRFGDNDLRLVLYAVVDGDRTDVARALREHLRARLPTYMLPQHVELLDALPKTPNGKIDRKALPEPSAAGAIGHSTTTATAPTLDNPREAYLAEVWGDLIGVSDIRRNDNFFDIGGHSLLAVEFANRVQRETGVRIALLDVATSTLAALAAELPEMKAVAGSGDASLGMRLRRLFGIK